MEGLPEFVEFCVMIMTILGSSVSIDRIFLQTFMVKVVIKLNYFNCHRKAKLSFFPFTIFQTRK